MRPTRSPETAQIGTFHADQWYEHHFADPRIKARARCMRGGFDTFWVYIREVVAHSPGGGHPGRKRLVGSAREDEKCFVLISQGVDSRETSDSQR